MSSVRLKMVRTRSGKPILGAPSRLSVATSALSETVVTLAVNGGGHGVCATGLTLLLQEIQGLQARNGALEGAMGTLMEERDHLVRTLKGHMPRCQDAVAMARSAQLLAFSHRLAQLLDWALPRAPPPPALASPSSLSPQDRTALAVELQQAPPPTQPPPPPHTPLPAHKVRESSASSSASSSHCVPVVSPTSAAALTLGAGCLTGYPNPAAVSPPHPPPPPHHPPPDLPSPGSAAASSLYLGGSVRSHPPMHGGGGQAERASGESGNRELEIDAAAAAALREEIERRHRRHSLRVSAPASPSSDPASRASRPVYSPRSSPPPLPHPASLPLTPTHPFPSPSRSLPPALSSPSGAHSLPAPLHSPVSHSLPAHLPSPSHPFPSPSLQPPHLSSPTLPFAPHLSSPSHPFPAQRLASPSTPRPSHLPLDTSGAGLAREACGYPSSFSGASPEVTHRGPLSPAGGGPSPLLLGSGEARPEASGGAIKRPQSLDLRGAGIIPKKDPALRGSPLIPKKDPALRSPVIPKKDPALRSPITPKKDPALRSPVIPKKDPALRSPLTPKKDPALRSPVIEQSPLPSAASSSLLTFPSSSSSSSASTSLLRSSGVFKRGPVQRVASFHGVSASQTTAGGSGSGEQMAPLNLSKRRRSEDFGSACLVTGAGDFHAGSLFGDQGGSGFSGLHTWPPPGVSSPWVKREEGGVEEEEEEAPLNLVCRDQQQQPSATVTSGQAAAGLLPGPQRHHHPFAFVKREGGLGVIRDDDDVMLTSPHPRRLFRYSSYDGSSWNLVERERHTHTKRKESVWMFLYFNCWIYIYTFMRGS